MRDLQTLRALPRHIHIALGIFLLAGAFDLIYHLIWVATPLIDTWHATLNLNERFNVDLAEGSLHLVVAFALVTFVIMAIQHRLNEDERRQVEAERRARHEQG